MRNIVSFYTMNTRKLRKIETDKYVQNRTGKLLWLKDKIFNYLVAEKYLSNNIATIESVERVDIDTSLLAEKMTGHLTGFQRYYGKRPSQILMGPDELDEFIHSCHRLHPKEFYYGGMIDIPLNGSGDRTFQGVKLTVVPHMKGYLIL